MELGSDLQLWPPMVFWKGKIKTSAFITSRGFGREMWCEIPDHFQYVRLGAYTVM
ncbi:MAG: hypothetical protein GVX96_04745 [Bacteroidetes bacterium]|jgi:hypothetical protein|nr:hypothetical protein [Bacteroidota bacterium]